MPEKIDECEDEVASIMAATPRDVYAPIQPPRPPAPIPFDIDYYRRVALEQANIGRPQLPPLIKPTPIKCVLFDMQGRKLPCPCLTSRRVAGVRVVLPRIVNRNAKRG